jgi:ectoine hydroxylase-related dioxygenase (phytanoyl-CoA dioxygenase family)
MNRHEVTSIISSDGYLIIENLLDKNFIEGCKVELEKAIAEEERMYRDNPWYKDYGMVMLCALYGGTFLKFFELESIFEPFNAVLGDSCIVYAYTSSSMPPMNTNYSNRVHVDCPRMIPGYPTNMGATILLDDFTEENGATYYLPASHKLLEKPSDDFFFKNSKRLTGKAGTIFFFDARLWHCGGANHTNHWRHALTLNMCRGYMKQRIDIPRAMAAVDTSALSNFAKQKLGYFAQAPASLDEYYVTPENRKFKQSNQ